jgi:HEAT repeats
MFRFITADRVLIGAAALWLGALWHEPGLHADEAAFAATLGLIAANALLSFRALTHRREVLIALNCVQIVLFGTLNYQLYCAFGAGHYRFDRPPQFYDWIEFTAAHVLRAADFLDALDEYGLDIQNINHNSTTAGILLVCMHLAVDVFLIGLVLRGLKRYWRDRPRETYLERGRREFAWLLATLAFYVGFAVCQQFKPSDWLLWPLENLLRLLDVGDMFQVFGWQLHGVEATGWTRGGAILFRVAAGIWMARLVIHVRLTLLRTWGLSVEQLTELLDDPDAHVRRGAALGLGRSGPAAHEAVAELGDALHDMSPEVRRAAAWALGQIGPPAQAAVSRLLDAAWLGHRELRLAATDALGRIGPAARSAAYSLVALLKVSDAETRPVVTHALAKIAPDVAWDLAIVVEAVREEAPLKPPKRKPWQDSPAAAAALHEQKAAVRVLLVALIEDGFFAEEQDTDSLRAALACRGHEVECAVLFEPLLDLTAEGILWRRRSDLGRWLYSARRKAPRVRSPQAC